jgi:hypothetical protein
MALSFTACFRLAQSTNPAIKPWAVGATFTARQRRDVDPSPGFLMR